MAQKEVKQWITVKGKHVPIFEGETKADAVKRVAGKLDDVKKQSDNKSTGSSKLNKATDNALKQLNFDRPGDYAEITDRHWGRLGVSNEKMAEMMSAKDPKYDYEYEKETTPDKRFGKVTHHRMYRVPKEGEKRNQIDKDNDTKEKQIAQAKAETDKLNGKKKGRPTNAEVDEMISKYGSAEKYNGRTITYKPNGFGTGVSSDISAPKDADYKYMVHPDRSKGGYTGAPKYFKTEAEAKQYIDGNKTTRKPSVKTATKQLAELKKQKVYSMSTNSPEYKKLKADIQKIGDSLPDGTVLGRVTEDTSTTHTSKGMYTEKRTYTDKLYKNNGKWSRYKDGSGETDFALAVLYNKGNYEPVESAEKKTAKKSAKNDYTSTKGYGVKEKQNIVSLPALKKAALAAGYSKDKIKGMSLEELQELLGR